MRVLIALPGLHRVHRGAEVALESVGRGLATRGHAVTLLGNGDIRRGEPYRFVHAPAISRERFERFPKAPPLRTEFAFEDLTFVPGALVRFRPRDFDVTITCSYPFLNWMLRRPSRHRPKHVFVTQNGDWPAWSDHREFRYFRCDGLVCTNPEYYARNEGRWPSVLIPNGVDVTRFAAATGDRAALGLPEGARVVLMVSALMPSKRVDVAVRALAELPDVHLVVAGDGPERDAIDALALRLMPGRFRRMSLAFDDMPTLYRSADVFLHTTLAESFGNVYIEAMAAGLPVVAHDSEVTRWILGAGDLLVDTDDASALRAAIGRAFDLDPEARAAASADAAARFAWDRVVDQYETFLNSVIERARATG